MGRDGSLAERPVPRSLHFDEKKIYIERRGVAGVHDPPCLPPHREKKNKKTDTSALVPSKYGTGAV